jgi:23S rRNA (guanosine2251-2'-O)-methyltransferase
MKAKGTGGKGKAKLAGKGTTPKAEDRVYHAAHQRKLNDKRKKQADPRYARAQKTRKIIRETKKSALDVVYGRNAVLEIMRFKVPVSRLVFAAGVDHDERTREVIELANTNGVQIYEAPRLELDAISKRGAHQGVLVQIPPYQYYDLAEITDTDRIVILDHITDPANLGAIVRSGAAFGANLIVAKDRSAGVNATVWKVSAGNLLKTKIAQVVNINQAIKSLKSGGWTVVGLDGTANTDLKLLPQMDFDKIAFVAGSEGAGISRLTLELCDVVVKIDTAIESLNVATATGIALYQASNGANPESE